MPRLSAAALAVTLAAAPAAAFDIEAMTPAEREVFREEVRDFLLERPEILLEAIGVLENREAEAQAAAEAALVTANAEVLFDDGYSWVGGNPEGDVTIVEFMDYRCGFCRQALPVIDELLARDGNIRLVIKEFPILNEQSVLASRFAIAVKAAHGDDAYWDVHEALMTQRADVTEAGLLRLAADAGWDGPALIEAMAAPEIGDIIAANRALATELGINGTPSFIVGNEVRRGFLPLDGMEALIAEAREG